ncbi:MAG: hypothetical protein ACFE94_19295 [Candidatus Hodarchaeota archaeon]
MDSIIYKVIFKAIQHFEYKNLTLNFKNLTFEEPLTIPSNFILELKNLSEKFEKIIFFQNIEEVIIVGNIKPNIDYNYYRVILFTLKSDGEKQGYLIGNIKDIGDMIIGIWPFNRQVSELTPEIIVENYHDIIKNPGNYSKICLIS